MKKRWLSLCVSAALVGAACLLPAISHAAEPARTNQPTTLPDAHTKPQFAMKEASTLPRSGFLSWFTAVLKPDAPRVGGGISAGNRVSTATIGIRGLANDGALAAKSNSEELQKLKLYSVSRLDAEDFGRSAQLAPSDVALTTALPALAGGADIGEQREIEMGDELAVSLLGGAKLLNNDAAQEYVNQVGRWLTLGTERVDLPWQFGIMNRSEIGAYPLPGGKVLVTLGMLKQLKTESELAAVLAHEIAHVLKRHQLQSLAGDTAQTNLGAITVALPPALEFEADRMAVVVLARAGYDPSAYLSVLRRLQSDRSKDAGLAMLSAVHPPFGERIAQLQPIVQRIGASITPGPTEPQRARFSAGMSTVGTPAR